MSEATAWQSAYQELDEAVVKELKACPADQYASSFFGELLQAANLLIRVLVALPIVGAPNNMMPCLPGFQETSVVL